MIFQSHEIVIGLIIASAPALLSTYLFFALKKERILDSLQNLGYRFAAFQSHTDQGLPKYILRDEDIPIIHKILK